MGRPHSPLDTLARASGGDSSNHYHGTCYTPLRTLSFVPLHYNAFTTTNGGHFLAWVFPPDVRSSYSNPARVAVSLLRFDGRPRMHPAPTSCCSPELFFRLHAVLQSITHWHSSTVELGFSGALWLFLCLVSSSFCRLHSTKKHDTNLSSFYERGKGLPRLRWLAFVSVPWGWVV